MRGRLILLAALLVAACSGELDSTKSTGSTSGDGGGTTMGLGGGAKMDLSSPLYDPIDAGGGPTTSNGVTFPWAIFDGTIPDVPPAAGSAHTWYCDPVKGNDTYDGTSFTFSAGTSGPKKTLGAMLKSHSIKAGDTVLLGGGIYREHPISFEGVSGSASAPVVFGSYGRGTGAPILDGGLLPSKWTKYNAQGQTTVWQSSTANMMPLSASQPVLGIYVNNGQTEAALKEVMHGQVTPYPKDPTPPMQTQADIKDMSSSWYHDTKANIVYADFGSTLGSGDPNTADISLLYSSLNSHQPLISIDPNSGNLTFIGITIRAASWHGFYSEASGITFDHCDVKFNGGGAIAFNTGQNDITVSNNSVIRSRAWMNVLANYPRFNNAFTGGGWPGGLSWYSQSNALAQGNLIYMNGGEGLVFYGTNASGSTGHVAMNNEIRNNLSFDNFSVNIYLDNTQNVTIEQNLVFDHPRDPGLTFDGLLTLSPGYDGDFGKRLTPVDISLADEPGSSYDGAAHLTNITVVNNILAGGPFGFIDYDDGTKGVTHGLKNCLIANNTWIISAVAPPMQNLYGWRHQNYGATDNSKNSIVENNLIVVGTSDSHYVETVPTAGLGITLDYEFYSGGGGFTTNSITQDLLTWQGAHVTWDAHSLMGDAMLTDLTAFSQPAAQTLLYDWSKAMPMAGSPTIGAGATLSQVTTDFTGAKRKSGAGDIGALVQP